MRRMMFRNVPKKEAPRSGLPLYLYNTLGKELQIFDLPERVNTVRMYNCGPTVYGVQHIGNLSMFVFTDVLRRALEKNGFPVKQVINITDFGHLTSDADEGEDKMTKGLKREKMKVTMENMAVLAERYTQVFFDDLTKLNIDIAKIEFPRASAYIPAQIAMIQTLEEKGYAYQTTSGVYFDTSLFPAYGALGGIDLSGLQEGARVAVDESKQHPTDFMLWKSDAKIGWDSPWGKGFPGWHIECSAMIRATLGEQIDIHTGGIEHIPIHHNNEIAQSEAATGKKPFSRFWMHRAHIQIEGGKIAKSGGNVIYLSEIIERGFHPLTLRYLFLGAHYRTNANFSWEALSASQTALAKLLALRLSLEDTMGTVTPPGTVSATWQQKFMERINDDLDTPGALAVVWEMTFVNAAESKGVTHAQYATFIRLLAPFAPHITEELWHEIGNKKSVHLEPWPKFDKKKLVSDTITIAVQINGKTRGEVQVPAGSDKEVIEKSAREAVADRLASQTVTRTIVVPGRLVNFVVTS